MTWQPFQVLGIGWSPRFRYPSNVQRGAQLELRIAIVFVMMIRLQIRP